MGGVVINRPSMRVLGASASPSSVTGTLTETTLATVVVPAGVMGTNGILRVQTLWTVTNSANNKTLQMVFGGTVYYFQTVTTIATVADQRIIANVNSVSSQKGKTTGGMTAGGWGTASGAVTTSAVNTASAANLTFTGTLANTGETITLDSYIVELILP